MAGTLVHVAVLTRDEVINDSSVHGGRFARELSDLTDGWLAGLFAVATAGVGMRMALVAVGGYGRAELAPGSDLDVLLLHDGKRVPPSVTETLWYPVWDAKVKLGHAVRSVRSDSSRAKRPPCTEESLITSSRVRTATPTRVPVTPASARARRTAERAHPPGGPGQRSFRASRAATARPSA